MFDVKLCQSVYSSQPAHSETIFDCQLCPDDPEVSVCVFDTFFSHYFPSMLQTLATASYDGTVKLWNITTKQCLLDLKGQDGILYSLSWAPDGLGRLISAASTGQM